MGKCFFCYFVLGKMPFYPQQDTKYNNIVLCFVEFAYSSIRGFTGLTLIQMHIRHPHAGPCNIHSTDYIIL